MIGEMADEVSTVASQPSAIQENVRILNLIAESNNRIASKIRDVQLLSEREILACGDVLSSIVGRAEQLAEESDQAVASSLARSEEVTARFVKGMREDILAQENAVQSVLDLASRIEGAIAAINDLTLSSKVLAINARIEAARLGAQGKGFTVIADSLAGLSGVIREASDKVGLAIGAVREGLPSVKARAASMNERTEIFIDEVAQQVKSVSMQTEDGPSSGRLGIIKELSNRAISHLQFQDPMSQKLVSIVGELDTAKNRVACALSGENLQEAAEMNDAVNNDTPISGEIMLF